MPTIGDALDAIHDALADIWLDAFEPQPDGLEHTVDCPALECNEHTFRCQSCGRWTPACRGCADDEPDWCDDCWWLTYGPDADPQPNQGDDMKKAKKINPLRAIALKSTMPAKKLSAFVAKYAKTHSLNNSEATAKLLSLAASRLASLAKDNARAAKKGRPNGTKPKGRKTAKAAPARSAKAAKPKAARKPAKRAPKAKAQAAPAAATE